MQEIGDQPLTIGRSSQNAVVLKNIHVSRRHCAIERAGCVLQLRDLDSQSGTFLNGERITEAPLYAGDRISVGPFDIVIKVAPDESALVSRRNALDAALSHVSVDEETGVPMEGPSALIVDLRRQIEDEQRQRADALAQVAALHNQVESLTRERDEAARASERSLLLEIERSEGEGAAGSELSEQLERERQRADDAEARLVQLAGDIEALHRGRELPHESEETDAATRIAELEGLIEVEQQRARSAEARQAELAAHLEQAERLANASDRELEQQAQLEAERQRAADATARAADLESRLSDALQQRENDAATLSELRGHVEWLERSIGDLKNKRDAAEAERRATLRQLNDSEREVGEWRERLAAAETGIETERAHSADLNRALEEAWARIEDLTGKAATLQERIGELEAAAAQQAQRAADALAEHVSEIDRLTEAEASLRRDLEQVQSAGDHVQHAAAEAQTRLETAESSLRLALSRADELDLASSRVRERLMQVESEMQAAAERAREEIAVRDRQIQELRASGESMRQRLNNLEATKYAAAEKAERALKTLNVLHSQIRSLDEATGKVTDLQQRLAAAEEAWVQADETLETIDESDESQLEAAVAHRQRLIAELDALNKARDQAVASLRESAQRLRSISERETPALVTVSASSATLSASATATAQRAAVDRSETEQVPSGNGGRKWWKFGGDR